MTTLPDYVSIGDPAEPHPILRQPAQPIMFPLADEVRTMIQTLEAKYDAEQNCAGLAAPQIGFHIQAIVFAVHEDPNLKKWRPDLDETMPKSIWLNPKYEPIGDEKHTDYEACFSVRNLAGPVPRYKNIRYEAYLMDGSKVSGAASGFLARVIQHEVDHIRGKCFVDYVPADQLTSIDKYRADRSAALALEDQQPDPS